MAVEPGADALHPASLKVTLQMGPGAGHEGGVAVAAEHDFLAGEDPAEDAGGVQRRERPVVGEEGLAVDLGPGGEIAVQHRRLELGRDVAAGVLEQVQQVPGRMAGDGVLEVEHADAGETVAVGEPEQVLGVIVAVDEDRAAGLASGDDGGPERLPFGGGVVGRAGQAGEVEPPLKERIEPRAIGQGVVAVERPALAGGLDDSGRVGFVQAGQGVGEEFVFIIAAVVGGCLLTGGYGSAIGATIGSAIIGMAFIGIAYAGWNTDWSWLFLGLILFVAVLTNSLISRRFQGGRR